MHCDFALRACVDRVVRPAGLTLAALDRSASQIVLFGSRAADAARESSDWDLLLVGEGNSLRTHEADIIWISPAIINSEQWLGSELASHVVHYGRWLWGADDWRHRACISPDAVRRKQAGVQFQLAELNKVWSSLFPGARARHIRRLRRDVQRFHLLSVGIAVPPTPHLDAMWMQCQSPQEDLEALCAAVRKISCSSSKTGVVDPTS
jgi:hypothetical protein